MPWITIIEDIGEEIDAKVPLSELLYAEEHGKGQVIRRSVLVDDERVSVVINGAYFAIQLIDSLSLSIDLIDINHDPRKV